jgi:hypothetical protein
MRKLSGILLLAGLFMLVPALSFAQKAKQENSFRENHTPFGRKKEKKNQRGTAGKISRGGGFSLFKKRKKSAGNADHFASNSSTGGRGFMYKIFHPNSGSAPKNASLRKTRPGKVQNREQPRLFRRILTNNKGTHERIQGQKRKDRARKRKRGNEVFGDKKH